MAIRRSTAHRSLPVMELVGRQAEIAEILDVVETGHSEPRMLLLLGEAGTGKSRLMAVAVGRARDSGTLLLASQDSAAESRQSFASLHQLLLPLLPDLGSLPDHLRGALETAFGIAPAEGPPDPTLLRVAVLLTIGALMPESATSYLTFSPLRDCEHIHSLCQLTEEGESEFLHLGLQVRGSAAVPHRGTKVLLEAGDLVFCDPVRLRFLPPGDGCEAMVFRIPLRHLGVSESDLHRLAGVPVRGGEGVGAMVSFFLSKLADGAESHGSRIGDRLARSALDLVTVLVMELLGEENEMLTRIKEFIEANLMDPDLSPTSIALAHHISARYLHKLFQSEGTTVSQWVRQRRLHVSRQELSRVSNQRLTVAAVASRSGFTSPSHFSRVFRDAYGMSPSEWQACTWAVLKSPITRTGDPHHRESVLTSDAA